MKKITLFVLLVVAACVMISCKGDTGPQGPSGDPSLGVIKMVFQQGTQPYAGYAGVMDTWLSTVNPTTLYENAAEIEMASTASYTGRPLIKFDLSAVDPDNVTVLGAYLTFNYGAYSGTVPGFKAYKMNRYWDDGACWSYSVGTYAWLGGGAEGSYTATAASDTVSVNMNSTEITLSLDKAMVEGWIKESVTNYGVILKSTNEGTTSYGKIALDSSEAADTVVRPKLTVYYTLK